MDHQNQKIIKARSCSKAILTGEHAVVYGARAIAIPLKEISTELMMTPSEKFEVDFHVDTINTTIELLAKKTFELFDVHQLPLVKIEGSTTIPLGAGLGSSASLCVSLIQLACQFLNRTFDQYKIGMLANDLESMFHGTPSGIDTTVIATEKIILFKKGEQPDILDLVTEQPFVSFALISSNIKASTEKMIAIAKPHFQSNKHHSLIEQFDTITTKMLNAIKQKDIEQIAHLMNHNHELLVSIGVSTPEVEQIVKYTKEIGCLGTKITGAGGGGCVLALLGTHRQQQLELLRKKFGTKNIFEVHL